MRVLWGFMAVALWSQVIFAAMVVRPQQLMLQSFRNIAALQLEVDWLVAQGYVLFAGEIQDKEIKEVTYKEFVLIRDAQSPIYRYGEKVIAFDDEMPIVGKSIAEGWKVELGDDFVVENANTYLHNRSRSTQDKLIYGWDGYRLKTADGSYPDTPATIDALQLVNEAHTVDMQPVSDYRVYRGEISYPRMPPDDTVTRIVETITINGNNPYIVYRYKAVISSSHGRTFKDERFSVGIYSHIAISSHIKETYVEEMLGSKGETGGGYFLEPDDSGNITLKEGSHQVPMQLIKQSDVWNEYDEGNIGTTGAGIESMLKRNYFNGEKSNN